MASTSLEMAAMHWTVRPGTANDLPVCIPMLEPYRPLYGEAGWACLEDFLRFLVRHDAIDIAIFCDGNRRDAPIIGFDISPLVCRNLVT
jgi:hypothetical protein